MHYEPLNNGIAAVADAVALQRLADRLCAAHVQRYFDRWLYRLPSPLTATDRRAGYTYSLSILQLEVSRTEVFDRPLHGRQFFEEVIREHLDLGRPEKIQLLFHKRLPRRRGEGPFRTRVFCADVDPSLQIRHRDTRCRQYWKCDRALRTETTINNAADFRVGKLLAALCDFRWLHDGFRARHLRPLIEHHLAHPYRITHVAYDLRRLQRKGLIERIAGSHRYTLTALGRRLALFCTKVYARVICPGIGQLGDARSQNPLAVAWRRFDREAETLLTNLQLAA